MKLTKFNRRRIMKYRPRPTRQHCSYQDAFSVNKPGNHMRFISCFKHTLSFAAFLVPAITPCTRGRPSFGKVFFGISFSEFALAYRFTRIERSISGAMGKLNQFATLKSSTCLRWRILYPAKRRRDFALRTVHAEPPSHLCPRTCAALSLVCRRAQSS